MEQAYNELETVRKYLDRDEPEARFPVIGAKDRLSDALYDIFDEETADHYSRLLEDEKVDEFELLVYGENPDNDYTTGDN